MVEDAVEVRVFAGVHDAVIVHVLIDGLKEQVGLRGARVVGPILRRVVEDVLKVSGVDVEGHRKPRREIDEVHRVVCPARLAKRVGAAALSVHHVLQVDVLLEGDADRGVGAPAIDGVEDLAGVTLEASRREHRDVDATARGRGRVRPSRDVVGQGNFG